MKTPILSLLVTALMLTIGCQKEPVTKPVYFTETEYDLLMDYDNNGKPKNLEKETVSSDLVSFVTNSLPERQDMRTTNPGLLSNPTVDMRITKKADVYLTFLSQGTGHKNAIAFYTYPTSTPPNSPKDIRKITYVLPNAGNSTALTVGDKIKIGTFEPGVSIGLVLLKGAWNSETKELNNNAVHFCYSDILNPEVDPKLKKHVVLLNYAPENKIIIGFEDVDRTDSRCDHDFNDVVMYATIREI